MRGFREALRASVSSWLALHESCETALESHYRLLLKWNRVVNLTKVTKLDEAVGMHYAESLFLGWCCPVRPSTLVDVGSGAGFPGFPLAALWPDCEVTLVESDARKAAFLRESRDLLPNLKVFNGRAEDLDGPFGAVVSRAVRPEDVVSFARGRAPRVGLLIAESAEAVLPLENTRSFVVPGGGRGVALWGEVSRGTK
ncbi:MAG: class I SAM-dependent methyltransferase [Bryobacteraceae bacterium]|nr:class I SAM-dependent methyltransferase [Bryobacteraceae bacterium]